MSKDINKIYGILVDGVPEVGPYYRYTTVSRLVLPANRAVYMERLIPTGLPSLRKKAMAELCIRLMQSSEQWPALVTSFDPYNTYEYETAEAEDPVELPSFVDVVAWAKVCPFGTGDTIQLAGDTDVDRVIKALCATVAYE